MKSQSRLQSCLTILVLAAWPILGLRTAVAEETAASKELARRLAALERRAGELSAAVEGIIKACGTCRGTGKFVHRGRTFDCPKCGGSGRIASKVMFKKARWDMMSPAFRTRPGANELHQAEYWEMIKRQVLPLPIGVVIEPRLIDATHGTTVILSPRSNARTVIRWIFVDEKAPKTWYVYDSEVDGEWPRQAMSMDSDDEASGGQSLTQVDRELQEFLAGQDLAYTVSRVSQQDLTLLVDLGALQVATQGSGPEPDHVLDAYRVLRILGELPAERFKWTRVVIRFVRTFRDRFGATVHAPAIVVSCDATTLRRIHFNSTAPGQVFSLMDVELPPNNGLQEVPEEGRLLLDALGQKLSNVSMFGVRFRHSILTIELSVSNSELSEGIRSAQVEARVRTILKVVRSTPIPHDRYASLDLQIATSMVSKFGEVADIPAVRATISREHLERIVFENVGPSQLLELLSIERLDHGEWRVPVGMPAK